MALKLALVREDERTGESEVLFETDLATDLADEIERLAPFGFRKRHRSRAIEAFRAAEERLKARSSELV